MEFNTKFSDLLNPIKWNDVCFFFVVVVVLYLAGGGGGGGCWSCCQATARPPPCDSWVGVLTVGVDGFDGELLAEDDGFFSADFRGLA